MSASSLGAQFVAERAALARSLQQASDDHRGSHDAQNFSDSVEYLAACDAIFAAGAEAPPTPRQKQQALVAFLRSVLGHFQLPARRVVFSQRTFDGLIAAAQELIQQATYPGGILVSPQLLLGKMADVAMFCCEGGEQLQGGQAMACRMCELWPTVWAPAAEGLEAYLRQEGFDPLLTESELRTLPLLLAGGAAMFLAAAARDAGDQQRSWEFAAQTEEAYRQLVALHPDRPALKMHLSASLQMGPPEQAAASVAMLREAFSQADASTDHWTAASCAQNLVASMACGFDGETFSLAEAQRVLERGEHHQRLAEAWLPRALGVAKQLAGSRKNLEADAAKAGPGVDAIRAHGIVGLGKDSGHRRQIDRQQCSCCGKWAPQLKRCSQCQTAKYCSRTCQRDHWIKGGHKQECAALAAQRQEQVSSQEE